MLLVTVDVALLSSIVTVILALLWLRQVPSSHVILFPDLSVIVYLVANLLSCLLY